MLKRFAGLIVMLVIIGIAGLAGTAENHYKMDATVYSVETDEVVFEDETGNLFSILETDTTYKVGDNVRIKFDANNTIDNRKDDKIVKVKRL